MVLILVPRTSLDLAATSSLDLAAQRLSATVKTRRQLEAERDEMVSQTIKRWGNW